jgi:hypothetical protein
MLIFAAVLRIVDGKKGEKEGSSDTLARAESAYAESGDVMKLQVRGIM